MSYCLRSAFTSNPWSISKRPYLGRVASLYVSHRSNPRSTSWSLFATRDYKSKIFLRHDIMQNVLAKFLDSKGVPQDAIENVISTKHYYSFHKEEFEHFEKIVVWLGTIGLHSGEGIGEVLMRHPNFLWNDINLLESKTRWFLKELKFQRHHLGAMLEKNPNLLFHHAEILGHFVQFLEMLRIDTSTIKKLITSRPELLEYCENLEEMQSLVRWLTMTVGLDHGDCGEILLKAPDLMNPVYQEPLPRLYEYLTRMGFSLDEIQNIMKGNPKFLIKGRAGFKHLAQCLRKNFGLKQKHIVVLMAQDPKKLTLNRQELRNLKYRLTDIGFNENQLCDMIRATPDILLPEAKQQVASKLEFLIDHMDRLKPQLIEFPHCLLLDKLFIKKRFAFLEKQYFHIPKNLKLGDILQESDREFATHVAGSSLAKYEQFEDWWTISSKTKLKDNENNPLCNEGQNIR